MHQSWKSSCWISALSKFSSTCAVWVVGWCVRFADFAQTGGEIQRGHPSSTPPHPRVDPTKTPKNEDGLTLSRTSLAMDLQYGRVSGGDVMATFFGSGTHWSFHGEPGYSAEYCVFVGGGGGGVER